MMGYPEIKDEWPTNREVTGLVNTRAFIRHLVGLARDQPGHGFSNHFRPHTICESECESEY